MKNLLATVLMGLGLTLGLLAQNSGAQNQIIDWYKVSGGGGSSTGATYSVIGTIGQTDTGAMSRASSTLTGGFSG